MGHVADHGRNLAGHTGHPGQQINVVHCMHKGAAAALAGPLAAPGKVVIAAATIPERVDLGVQQLAGDAALDQPFGAVDRGQAAALCYNFQLIAGALGGLDHLVALLQRGGHRLFDHDMAAVLQRVDCDLFVGIRRGHDRYDITAGIRNGLLVVGVGFGVQTGIVDGFLGGFLMAGHDAHDLGAAVQPFKRVNVGAADGTGADQQYFVHRCCLLFVDKRKKGRAVRVAAAGKARPNR